MVQTSTTSTRYNYWNVKTLAGNSGANAIHTENNMTISFAITMHHRRWCYFIMTLVFVIPALRTVKRNWWPSIKVCRKPSLLVYRGSQTIRAFKLWYVTADCSSVTLHTLVRWMSPLYMSSKVVHERQLKHIFLLKKYFLYPETNFQTVLRSL